MLSDTCVKHGPVLKSVKGRCVNLRGPARAALYQNSSYHRLGASLNLHVILVSHATETCTTWSKLFVPLGLCMIDSMSADPELGL